MSDEHDAKSQGFSADGATGAPHLSVDLAAFGLTETFEWLQRRKKSGRVEFLCENSEKQAYLHDGEIVFAASNQSIDRLGECLLRAGVIGLEQLREAERCYRPPARFGRVLVERGFLTPRELWNGVKYQVEEIVRSLFTYDAGRVDFFEGAAQPDNVVRLALSASRLAQEGTMRREEISKFRELLAREEVSLSPDTAVRSRLSPAEKEITDRIGDGVRLAELVAELPFAENELLRQLQLLRLVGAIDVTRTETASQVVGVADIEAFERDELERTAASGGKLIAALASEIAEVEGEDAVRERLERTLEDAAAQCPEILGGLALTAELSVDAGELVSRALRGAADPEEQLRAALGEVIAYLEFELKNHPGIDDPDQVLSRARSSCPWEA